MSPLWELDLTLQAGDFRLELQLECRARVLALYGPSGAGKSTVVECLAGARDFEGSVRLDGRDHQEWRVGWVPQEGALFPHLTVAENVDFAGCRGESRDRAIDVLGIGGLLGRGTAGLSGGERQRVALARALASEPDVLLLDEPLTGVDLPRRARIFSLLQQIRDGFSIPMLYVSHDPLEVQAMAEQTCLLDEGRTVACGPPQELLAEARRLRAMHWLAD